MTIAHDATTALGSGTGTLSATHTPVGTPAGATVLIVQNTGKTNEVTSVTYGGVAMTLAVFQANDTTEDGAVYIYHLGVGIPTGAQTVTVNVNVTASTKVARVQTQTAASTTQVATTASSSGDLTDPSVTLVLESYRNSYALGVLFSGHTDVASLTAATGFTDLAEHDFGSSSGAFIRADSEDAGGGQAVGWTATVEDSAIAAVAIEESTLLSGTFKISGVAQSGAKIDVNYAADTAKASYVFKEVVTTDGSGAWSAYIPASAVGFANGSYTSGGTYYTAPSQVFLSV